MFREIWWLCNQYPLRLIGAVEGEPLHLTLSDPILPPFSGIFFTISRSERRRHSLSLSLSLSLSPLSRSTNRGSSRGAPLGQFLSFKVSTVDMKIVLSQSVSRWRGALSRPVGMSASAVILHRVFKKLNIFKIVQIQTKSHLKYKLIAVTVDQSKFHPKPILNVIQN